MPRTDNLPYAWYETPNIHFCSIKDFRELCRACGAKMEQAVALNAWGGRMRLKMPWWFWESVRRASGILAEPAGLARSNYRFITASWIARQ
jgi:hypothetical protein